MASTRRNCRVPVASELLVEILPRVDGAVHASIVTWMAVTMVPDGVAGAVAWWAVSAPA